MTVQDSDVKPEEFRFTFGMKYRTEEHPAFDRAHPEGWLTVVARGEEQARAIVYAVLGRAWAFCYREPFDAAKWEQDFPMGEIARIDASLTQPRDAIERAEKFL